MNWPHTIEYAQVKKPNIPLEEFEKDWLQDLGSAILRGRVYGPTVTRDLVYEVQRTMNDLGQKELRVTAVTLPVVCRDGKVRPVDQMIRYEVVLL